MPSPTVWSFTAISISNDMIWMLTNSYIAVLFYMHQHHQALKKRDPFLVYLMTICILLFLIRQAFMKVGFVHGYPPFEVQLSAKQDDDHFAHTLNAIANIVYFFTLHGMAIGVVGRTWMLRFNTEWGLQLQQHQWFVHINSDIEQYEWYMRHRKDWGSKRYVYTIALSYYLIEAIVLLLLHSFSSIGKLIDSFLYLFELIAIIYFWNKVPQFNDAFLIKRELQIFIRVAAIAVIGNIIYTIQYSVFGLDVYTFLIWETVFTNLIGLMGMVLTGYIVHRHPKLLSMPSESLSEIATITTDENTIQHSLEDVLRNDEWITSLFQHLSHEFSVELLISFIEFYQFKQLMLNDIEFINNINDMMKECVFDRIELADILPQSKIVYETYNNIDNNLKRYLWIANDLYEKYIGNGAEFEVNISGRCKGKIVSLMEKLKDIEQSDDTFTQQGQYEIFTLFDDCAEQIRVLLTFAQVRCEEANDISVH